MSWKLQKVSLGWPVNSVAWVGGWIGECGSKQLFLLVCCSSVRHVLYFIYQVGFYVAHSVIRGMCVAVLLTADAFLHYSRRCVSTDYHKFWCPDVWDTSETFGHFRLMVAWDYRMWDELFSFLFLSLLPPRSLSIYRWEQQLFMSRVSMDTIIDSSYEFDTCVVCMCILAGLLRLSLTLLIHSPSVLSLQQPAPLAWRIWVIWTTKGLLDTGAPSANTTQLDAQMMTPKVFCGPTSGWNRCVNIQKHLADLCGTCSHFSGVTA